MCFLGFEDESQHVKKRRFSDVRLGAARHIFLSAGPWVWAGRSSLRTLRPMMSDGQEICHMEMASMEAPTTFATRA